MREAAEPGFVRVVETPAARRYRLHQFRGLHRTAGIQGWPLKGFYFGSSGPEVLDALKAIGFNMLSLSNNHAFDLGPSGILSTLEEVGSRDFLHAGIGIDRADAESAGIAQLGGREGRAGGDGCAAPVRTTCMPTTQAGIARRAPV